MNLPYQYLSRLGQSSILCAAKGGSIHTFDLDAGNSFLSSWTHPTKKKPSSREPQAQEKSEEDREDQEDRELDEQESGQRPAKKRKLNEDKKPSAEEGDNQADTKAAEEEAEANGDGKKKPKSDPRVQGPEIPFVALMTSTEDGKYLVAVSGQDKTVWVFEHDGKGFLKELSQRVMPKRPSSIAITPDGNTILSADKFGDVYALPLIPTSTPEEPSTPSTPSSSVPAPSHKPAANRLTVHSQRNLRALEEQERILASRKDEPAKEAQGAKYEPILGHVSMLTALVLATADGKPYIITADRDEHIRVSRGIPQAHIIENYCLGHEAFLNALCIPASFPQLLVAGGGDDTIAVWEWKTGRLVGRSNLLSCVRKVVPTAERVALSQLHTYDVDGKSFVLAVCESVPAVFVLEFQSEDRLACVDTLHLQANPLNVCVIDTPQSAPKLAIATDPQQPPTNDAEVPGGEDTPMTEPAQSLLLFQRDEAGKWAQKGGIQDIADGNLDISRKDLETILYTVENLRKPEFTDDGNEEAIPTPKEE
ncbi:hypothetical protein F5Y11DRAFT_310954 [Daldinia sp. FL1419]|nr:hypothetical protein F5Y11DRAFT_310954 [Daldinia sp. FL1419]